MPPAVVVVVLTQDLLAGAGDRADRCRSIPVFMVLVGMATERRTRRQWRTLSALGGHFLDVVDGLPTLKVFGRARAQVETIRRVTDEHRRATMGTLRVAFLSSLVLELLATISVALVAVSIGLRLVDGGLDLRTGLVVLVLAPEAYLPLRQVGAHFHASAEGLAAAEQVFAVLDTPRAPARPRRPAAPSVPDLRRTTIRVEGLHVAYDRDRPALAPLDLEVRPGEYVGLAGPSGAGKSTLLAVLLRFVAPTGGRVVLDGPGGPVDLAAVDPDAWRSQVAWVPQDPWLAADSVAANVRLARPDATDDEVAAALRLAHASEFVAALPQGAQTVLGERGAGLSAGQRQRIALARAFLRDAPLVLLDEPTAHLDADSEAAVVDAVRRLARGRTVVAVAHRPALLAGADRVVTSRRRSPVTSEPAAAAGAAGERRHERADPAGRHRPRRPPAGWRWAALLGAAALAAGVGLTATAGLADRPGLAGAPGAHPHGRGGRGPVLRHRPAGAALRRAAGRPRRRVPGAGRPAGPRSTRGLEPLAPARLGGRRRGDLLAGLVSDVDAVEDLHLRVREPVAIAVLVSAACVGLAAWLLPSAGAVLAVALLVAGAARPVRPRPRWPAGPRPPWPPRARRLSAAVVDLLRGAPDLLAVNAAERRLAEVEALDAALHRDRAPVGLGGRSGLRARRPRRRRRGVGLGACSAPRAVRSGDAARCRARRRGAAAARGVRGAGAAAAGGRAGGPGAAGGPSAVRAARRRAGRARPSRSRRRCHAGPYDVRLRAVRVRWAPGAPVVLDGLDLDLPAGRRVAVVGASGPASRPWPRCCCGSSTSRPGR